MAVMWMLAVGIVAGLIAHLILGKNGYSFIGEILLGSVGAIAFGLIFGVFIELRQFKPEVIIAAAIGAVLVLAVVVYVSLKPRGAQSID